MEERSRRTIIAPLRAPIAPLRAPIAPLRAPIAPLRAPIVLPRAPLALLLSLALITGGCIGRHAGPRTLAAIGGLVVGAGSATWAAGESVEGNSASTTGRALTAGGFAAVAVGLAAIVAAGGWMAAAVACDADPDCPEEETCREVPAPPGGVPYKQCVPRS